MITDRRVHTTLPTQDLDRARAFYEGTLGFTPYNIQPTGVLYHAGAGTLFAVTQSSGSPSGSHTQMGITTSDIESDVADLKGRGVAFEEYDYPTLKTVDSIASTGRNRAAWFKDTDGNLVGLIEFATTSERRGLSRPQPGFRLASCPAPPRVAPPPLRRP